ncbi:HNH endonuclease [Novosphingobium sp.]|uniref:HNH endonuclease n=1 Tax=Novosphingobium sp. TaxID=1874826 RepID=UPI00261E4958|nr:HNH endonuclease [Novosphingobium sp.]
MAGADWSKSVELAVARQAARSGGQFQLQELVANELERIVRETGSRGLTPEATLRRELQQLRDRGGIEFVGSGHYRMTASPLLLPGATKGKCVFVVGSHSIYADQPDRFYRFPQRWLNAAARSLGQWVIYQEPRRAGPRGYYAIARVEQIVRDPADPAMYLALIEPGSYLEFGRDVPFQLEGQAVERGLLYQDGRLNNGRAIQSIRSISDVDFDHILRLGLVGSEELLPREDSDVSTENRVREDWLSPVERETALVSRTVRDRQFRKRVLEAYEDRCALTGMKLINGGGRVETQAAHIMGVEHKGPDRVENGIALSGTVHWMFDRGLISLSNDGDILLSHKINDLNGVAKLLHSDRRARLPANSAVRPDVRFLAWHREYHRFAA